MLRRSPPHRLEQRIVAIVRKWRPEAWQVKGAMTYAIAWLQGRLILPEHNRRKTPFMPWYAGGRRLYDG